MIISINYIIVIVNVYIVSYEKSVYDYVLIKIKRAVDARIFHAFRLIS